MHREEIDHLERQHESATPMPWICEDAEVYAVPASRDPFVATVMPMIAACPTDVFGDERYDGAEAAERNASLITGVRNMLPEIIVSLRENERAHALVEAVSAFRTAWQAFDAAAGAVPYHHRRKMAYLRPMREAQDAMFQALDALTAGAQ